MPSPCSGMACAATVVRQAKCQRRRIRADKECDFGRIWGGVFIVAAMRTRAENMGKKVTQIKQYVLIPTVALLSKHRHDDRVMSYRGFNS